MAQKQSSRQIQLRWRTDKRQRLITEKASAWVVEGEVEMELAHMRWSAWHQESPLEALWPVLHEFLPKVAQEVFLFRRQWHPIPVNTAASQDQLPGHIQAGISSAQIALDFFVPQPELVFLIRKDYTPILLGELDLRRPRRANTMG